MIRLPKIFSDNALFLHSAPLDLIGHADPFAEVCARIEREGETVACASATADEDGRFTIRLTTPAPSFLSYRICVSNANDSYAFDGVLFGELWLAAGQSNMQMANEQQPSWRDDMAKRIQKMHLRFFDQPKPAADAQYPIAPSDETDGWWIVPDDEKRAGAISALATAFCLDLYDFFAKANKEIPVAILNCSRGGTNLETWLPPSAFEAFESIRHRAPDLENWNQKGLQNYVQSCAHFNYNTYAHLGAKVRGVLWYQGEYNLCEEQRSPIYKELLIALRESYKELFAADPEAPFPVVCSQIYPYCYTKNDESFVGYFNQCFSDLSKRDPEAFGCVPVCDLSPAWNYHTKNHPIHPVHKYQLGERFARLCENICYGRNPKSAQRKTPMLKSCVRHGNKLRLCFENVGSGLFVKGNRVRGIYLRSAYGAYVPAECEIVNKSVLLVYHPSIDKPKHVAYAVSSHETTANLMAGEFPVAPFCTEFSETKRSVSISRKPWLDLSLDSDFCIGEAFSEENREAGSLPIYYPLDGSSLCYDGVISRSGRSLRVTGPSDGFGVRIPSRIGARLDLENYDRFSISLYNAHELHADLRLLYANGTKLDIPAVREISYHDGFVRLSFPLYGLKKGEITEIRLRFAQLEGGVAFANIDEPMLVAKR